MKFAAWEGLYQHRRRFESGINAEERLRDAFRQPVRANFSRSDRHAIASARDNTARSVAERFAP
ncbi:MAG: hypothetical protein JNK05_31255 [Myxococcales bacterium]|nr:hypothetical protein [Myxococcales bacterium]